MESFGRHINFDRYYDPPEPPPQFCPICSEDSEKCKVPEDIPLTEALTSGYVLTQADSTFESNGIEMLKSHDTKWEDYENDDPPDFSRE